MLVRGRSASRRRWASDTSSLWASVGISSSTPLKAARLSTSTLMSVVAVTVAVRGPAVQERQLAHVVARRQLGQHRSPSRVTSAVPVQDDERLPADVALGGELGAGR